MVAVLGQSLLESSRYRRGESSVPVSASTKIDDN